VQVLLPILENVTWECILASSFAQEIKFEPNVMCEHIDKKSTFKNSQVTISSLESQSLSSSCSTSRLGKVDPKTQVFQSVLMTPLGWLHCVKLEDGDIICYQKTLTREEEDLYRYPDVPSFLEYVRNRQVICVVLCMSSIFFLQTVERLPLWGHDEFSMCVSHARSRV
jgi:hypothetical protein